MIWSSFGTSPTATNSSPVAINAITGFLNTGTFEMFMAASNEINDGSNSTGASTLSPTLKSPP